MIGAVMAGGRLDPALARAFGAPCKALATVHGAPLVDRTLAAARGCGALKLALIGESAVLEHRSADVDISIEAVDSGEENLRRALSCAGDEPLLLLACDLPFVTAEALAHFIAAARNFDAAMPLATAHDYERTYPSAPAHATTLAGERVVNASVFYFGPGIAARMLGTAERFFTARKSLFAMASLLGPALLAKFALRRLRIEDVERRAREVLGVEARAVRNCSPVLCFDVDTLEDYRYASGYADARS